MNTSLRIYLITIVICIVCNSDCEAKPYRLHPVDSTAYSIKVALDSIVIPGSRRRILVVTRKYAPGVMPEFHYEPDTTGLIYVYRRNAREIVFEDHDGPLLGPRDNPYAILRTQYGTIVFDKSIKDWVSVSPNAVSVEMRVGDWRQLDGNICSIRHGHPLPDDYWTRRFTIKDIIY